MTKRYGERLAVDGVGFHIGAGECYGLLGPNGAGKTTTISMICGLLDSDGGGVRVEDEPVTVRSLRAKGRIGYVPQDIALYLDLGARENLRFFGRLYGLKGAALDERIDAVLAIVGLSDRADERIERYSGGMKRRANIAAGLLHRPALLVLDEPTVGVDPQSRHAILETVRSLADDGMAVLYTTHYMEEAERLCDRLGIIDEGRLIAEGTRRELVANVGQRDRIRIGVAGDAAALAAGCRAIDPELELVVVGDGGIEVLATAGRRLLAPIIQAAETAAIEITGIEVIEPDLEAVFLHLTGKALRD
ncbi:MAG: ABC transporter ATP-binding protein [Actinobacteria bacterium]|nr:ABC transporter ATP-binding protein [Actinomycetota bacterium]